MLCLSKEGRQKTGSSNPWCSYVRQMLGYSHRPLWSLIGLGFIFNPGTVAFSQVQNNCTTPTCSVTLAWSQPSQSNTPVKVNVYRNSTFLGSVVPSVFAYTDPTPESAGTYTYGVTNVDVSSNESVPATLSVTIGSVTPPPTGVPETFTVTPKNLTLSSSNGSTPIGQLVCFSDTSPGNPTYTLTSDSKWLSATVSTTFVPNCGYRIPITVNITGLTPGVYNGSILVTVPDQMEGSVAYTWTNSPMKIPVVLTISGTLPPPQSMTTVCSFSTPTVWTCNSTMQNVPSGQAIRSVTTTGSITNTTNGVKP